MNSGKRYTIAITVTIITIVVILITSSFLPVLLRDQGSLYQSYEYAQMYLNDDEYDELLIEYDYMPGSPPSPISREIFIDKLEKYTVKDKIKEKIDDEISYTDSELSYDEKDVQYLTNKYHDEYSEDGQLVLHILYLDNSWKDRNVLGLSYEGNHIVILKQSINEATEKSDSLDPANVESSVLVHEIGHLFSLVGINYESNHEDSDYEHHCNQEEGPCVMASSVEVVVGGISPEPPTDFCSLCKNDLEKIKNLEDDIGLEDHLTYIAMTSEGVLGIAWIITFISDSKDQKRYY